MKTNVLLFSLIISLLTCNLTFAQKHSEYKGRKTPFHNKYRPQFRKKSSIDIIGGTSIPSGNLKTFTNNGVGAQITFHKFISPKFSLGLGANYDMFSNIIEIESSEKMKNLIISVGPEYSIYFGKFVWQLYGHIGSSFIQVPETQVFYKDNSQFVTQRISQQKTNFITSKLGTNLGIVLSDRIRVNLNTEYIKPIENKITYQTRDLSKAEKGGRIDPEAAAQIPFEYVNLSLSNMSVKLGISIDFGKISQPKVVANNNSTDSIPPPLQAQDWNSSRSNKTSKTQRTVNPNSNNPNGNEIMRGGRGKARRDCLESGGAFMEKKDSWFCMQSQSLKTGNSGNNGQVQKMNKRKCWRQGGTWVTNSHGSYCYGAQRDK